jgi:protein ImuA
MIGTDQASSASRLSRGPRRPVSGPALWGGAIAFATGRVHEFCGTARRTLALQAAAAAGAPVIWIVPAHGSAILNGAGMADLIAPQDVIFVAPARGADMLWAMEEALRSGAAPAVIADLPEPPGMTPVRRLHLAAEAGAAEGYCTPLGLILTPGDGGAPGIETRWRMEPAHTPGQDGWNLTRLRARMAPPAAWQVADGRLTPVSVPDQVATGSPG